MEFENISDLNSKLEELTGINTFFKDRDEFIQIRDYLKSPTHPINFLERGREWGDYQTPTSLTNKICKYLKDILGKKANSDLKFGEPLKFEDTK